MGAGVVEHGAPGGGGGLHAEAEEAERGFGEDGAGHADGGLHEHGLDDVGQDVVEHQAEIACAERARGLHEFALLHGHDLAADEARVVDPAGERERDDEVDEAGAEEGDDRDREQDSGQSEEGVGEVEVDERVGPALVKAGEAAEDAADDERGADDGDGDEQRDARAVEGAREDVAAELVGAEPVRVGGRKKALREVELGGVVRREQRGEDGAEREECQQGDTGCDHRVGAQRAA